MQRPRVKNTIGVCERHQEASVARVDRTQGRKTGRGPVTRATEALKGKSLELLNREMTFKKDDSGCSVEETAGLKNHGRKSNPFAWASAHTALPDKPG